VAAESYVLESRIAGKPAGINSSMLHGPLGNRVARIRLAGPEHVDQAVAAAASAAVGWRSTPPTIRGEVLSRASQIVAAQADRFASVITAEEGKTLREAALEVERSAQYLSYFGSEGWRFAGHEAAASEVNLRVSTRREPIGVVGLITPWNFPLAIPTWKVGPALVAGNAIVLKPALEAPGASVLLAEALEEAGLPPGVLNVLLGDGRTIGAALVSHMDVGAISFTGSTAVGREIAVAAGRRMARVQLELGGSNAVVVLDDADIEVAAELIARSAFGMAGQACTATSRVYCTRAVADNLTRALVTRANALTIGVGDDLITDVGPLINAAAHERVYRLVQAAVAEGASNLTPGRHSAPFFTPTVLANVSVDSSILRTEVFGPVVSVVTVDSLDEAIERVNDSPYGLVASVITDSLTAAQTFIDQVRTGTVKVNRTTTGNQPNVPFGGVKDSSNASFKEQGFTAVDFYSHTKSVYLGW
jgi:acyl-CoA reductase-like NAD-dependent aldehyde dehydrogenase